MQDLYAVRFARLYECCQPNRDIRARHSSESVAVAKANGRTAENAFHPTSITASGAAVGSKAGNAQDVSGTVPLSPQA